MLSLCFLSDIEAECQDDYMKIRVGFNGTFTGLVYSAGNFKIMYFHHADENGIFRNSLIKIYANK